MCNTPETLGDYNAYIRNNPTIFQNPRYATNQQNNFMLQRNLDWQNRQNLKEEARLERLRKETESALNLPPALAAPAQPIPFDLSLLAPPAPTTFFGSTDAMRKQQKTIKTPAMMRRGTEGTSGKKPFLIPRAVNA